MDTDHQTYVGSKEMEIEIPDDYDPTAQKIAALQKEKEQAQTEFAQKVAQINERISKLQALEYTAWKTSPPLWSKHKRLLAPL